MSKKALFKFERARFHVETGPASLFQRVRFVMGRVRRVKIDGPHFCNRIKKRKIPLEVVKMVAAFNASEWSVLTAEVRIDKGKFVASSWGKMYNGRYYVVIIGLGNVAETIYDVDSPHSKIHSEWLNSSQEIGSELYTFVEKVNQELMESETDHQCACPVTTISLDNPLNPNYDKCTSSPMPKGSSRGFGGIYILKPINKLAAGGLGGSHS